MFSIADRLECFFDQQLLDMNATTAEIRLHAPRRREHLMTFDAPWEGDMSNYFIILHDDDRYRMYYLGWSYRKNPPVVCYAESRDGLTWHKPQLGICEFNGSKANNIILDQTQNPVIDNFMAFKDENPRCRDGERYKAVVLYNEGSGRESPSWGLYAYVSPDGIHFTRDHLITREGFFDSVNVAFWDKTAQKYRCYFRSFHTAPEGAPCSSTGNDIRDIRYMESEDFISWSEPAPLNYGDAEDFPLYTNNVQPYYRAPHILVGLPTRYVERVAWNDSFNELCGKEQRLERMRDCGRYGLVVTDALFMTSRNGVDFKKYDEAWVSPNPENGRNWTYGDCYFAYGIIETPSDIEGEDPEMSFYAGEDSWMRPVRLYRYTLRRDGFVSLHAGAQEHRILTKEFTYKGGALTVNFSTSARGYAYFTLIDSAGNRHESSEYFGNSTQRKIRFGDDAILKNSGHPVRLEVRLREADLYSIRFHN